jgi:hypothetical protein
MARRITRNPTRSRHSTGQYVAVDGGAGGDYFGIVLECGRYSKPASSRDPVLRTKVGTTVRVERWEGQDLSPSHQFQVIAWDTETRPWVREGV